MVSRFRKQPGPREVRKPKRPAAKPITSTTAEQRQEELLVDFQTVAMHGRTRRPTRTQRLAFGLGL